MTDLYSHVTGHWQRHGRGEAPRKKQKNEQNGQIKIERKLNPPFIISGKRVQGITDADGNIQNTEGEGRRKTKGC